MLRYRAQHRCHVVEKLEVLWITRRQSQLESEPCEAGWSNPSRRHGSQGLSEQDERYATSSQVQDEVLVLQRELKAARSME